MAMKVLIIGGVATGTKAASRIKRINPDLEVTILEQGETISYGACGLPYFVSDVIKEHKELLSTPIGVIRDQNFFKNVKGVTIHTKTRAEEIDRSRKVVTAIDMKTGERKEFPYDKLILATGGSPVIPPLKGVNLKNIYTLRTIEDGVTIKSALAGGEVNKAVIVGAGLIGLEMAEAFDNWVNEVTIVEMLDWVLPAILDKDMGLILSRYLEGEGINILTSEKVMRFEGDGNGRVTRVVTDKNELEADLVLLCIGVKPNVELAKKAALAIGKTGAIKVNEFFQTSDPDIYAGGDCVENVHRLTGKTIYAPLGSTANKHGRFIADHITGNGDPFPGVLGTTICKVLDFHVAKTGLSEQEALRQSFEVETVICPGQDRPHYYPGRANIIVKLIADKKTSKLLGAQIIGPGDVAKRLEIVVSVISLGGSVKDLATLDLAYAPPYSQAMDNIITAANVMKNKLKGLAKSLSPLTVKKKLDAKDDFIFLDVRSPQEYDEVHIDQPKVKFIPLGKLREECKNLPRDQEIIAFCRFSLRGYEAQKILEGKGFKNVKFMDGGLLAWPFEMVGKIWH